MTRSETKQATRDRVVATAARSVRRAGFAGTGVAAVMAEAGLTHGGFYAHFASKDALTAAAVAAAFAESGARLTARFGDLPPDAALAGWIDLYLDPRHRDRPERGCVLPALAAEAARGDPATRDAVAAGFTALRARVGDWLAATGRDPALAASLVAEAAGAIMIARVLGPTPESDAVLAAARASLRARSGVSE